LVSLIKREYDYALRITAYLSSIYPEGGRTINQISRNLQITKSLTTRITYMLIKGGILRSRKGRQGGIYMDQDPAQKSVLDILKAMNYESTVNACLKEEEICPLVTFCPIRRRFMSLDNLLSRELDGIRIKDIMIRENQLIDLAPRSKTGGK